VNLPVHYARESEVTIVAFSEREPQPLLYVYRSAPMKTSQRL
jgi:hypothetical protein